MKKISISTTTHLCNNPRLVKELSSLDSLPQYKVEVNYFLFDYKKTQYDQEIIDSLPNIKFKPIYWYSKNYVRLFWGILSKILNVLHRYLKISLWEELQLFPGYFKLYQTLKKSDAQIYHGHNLGTLAAIVKVSSSKNKVGIFDAEDFHRGETQSGTLGNKLTIFIEDKYIPQLKVLISASPLITKEYKQLFPKTKQLTINNVFDKTEINTSTINSESSLKCIWFSQNIGLDRGLQDILRAIDNINNHVIELDLIGFCSLENSEILGSILSNKKHRLNFIETLSAKALNEMLYKYDVGIASEPGKDHNNKLALSNKLFQYVKAGLAIIVSKTPAQELFMQTFPELGRTYDIGNTTQITDIFNFWCENKNQVYNCKEASLRLSKTILNWEIEQKKFLNMLENVIE